MSGYELAKLIEDERLVIERQQREIQELRAELQERIDATNTLIAHYESAISLEKAPLSSLFANVRALKKLRHRLEEGLAP